ncbi:tyrosine-protein kinase SYK-like [Mercenaria mercenaria]|uniref:tyrosine-protein kinase SYK-like n=1 Tax=Mercenaria mercenaria TaxID=6596 RepID=UPI00234ED568|nr:tyrosine-protein kinase SYK-like [Mercenaria mercenaria]XP_045178340.2 tyrosine-protein kinase SYK-like [Mercenaria mercenaria]XP_045178342.2 tyrosine-protein kinase SYK-like [Mercenaria mercenaria]XP_045178343.2 tyrosine-protein kinase SYK-like [Mercenaria mercenaria]XP_045178344.2 tyrosine-protein kinase SYK-like [Mercenaria mercenaria]
MAVSGRKILQDISSRDVIRADEDLDIFCQPCDLDAWDGPRVPAFGFCTNCKEHLCQMCFNHHKKATPSRHHVLLHKDEMAKSQLQRLSTFQDDPHEDFTKPCSKHTKERIRFYCHRHSSLICSICMLEHRYCCVNYIPEISGKSVDSNEYNDITENISALVKMSRRISKEAKENAEMSKHSFAEALIEVQKLKKEIRQKTDEIERKIETLEKDMHKETGKMVENTDEICETAIRTLEGMLQRLRQLNTSKQPNKLFVELKEAVPKLQHCKNKVNEAAGNIDTTKLLFHPNETLMAMIKSDTAFGETEVVKEMDYINENPLYLPADAITLLEPLEPGMRRGTYTLKSGQEVHVAVKIVEQGSAQEVLSEAQLMLKISHKHIIKMIGLCKSDNVMLVIELAPLGNLRSYLANHKETTQAHIVELLWQVAVAMEYLEKKRIVHGNLAARNVLLVSEHYAKVTDFRMSLEIKDGEEFYEYQEARRWPLKWFAPECIYYWQFNSKSDVWAYGVTLWEATSYGMQPYLKMKGKEILDFLFEDGRRLSKPEHCLDEVYSLMLQCWEYDKTDRPTFQEITTEMYALLRRQ